MVMKKLIALMISSAALIGLGIGITLLELRDWKISEIRTDLLDMPLQTATYERTVDLTEVEGLEIASRYGYGYYNEYMFETEIIKDKKWAEQVLVEIDYRGYQPMVYQNISWRAEDKVYHQLWIDNSSYVDGVSVYSLLESMFENKTWYQYGESSYIEKVTVYTAYPEKISK